MCGIVGIVGTSSVAGRLVGGLKRLEYRGYDSAGIAVLNGRELLRSRAKGKIASLEAQLEKLPVDGAVGIAHTRWATHGKPTLANAHPHFSGRVGVVHNGIIENYAQLRANFETPRKFASETDTKVIAHIIDDEIERGLSPQNAFRAGLKKLTGAFALGVIVEGHEDHIFVARRGSPLAIGVGDGENYIGSDALALAPLTNEIIYLEEGDWAIVTSTSIEIFDENDNSVTREVTFSTAEAHAAEKGSFAHFMLKEIHEQPMTVARALSYYADGNSHTIIAPNGLDFSAIDRLSLIACGTASYAGHVAKYWFEQIAGLPCDIDIASEFRYRRPALSPKGMAMVISQSGETADTLAALRYCKERDMKTAALVNVMTSTMAREADIALPILAGPEIGVASTKAFTAQLSSMLALAVLAARQRGAIDATQEAALTLKIMTAATQVENALLLDAQIRDFATDLSTARSAFFLGRGPHFPLALEGALKLKEISYIHAEGYAAGELKHGPIALIENGTPVIVIAPFDELFQKTISNMQEVLSRGAKVLLITDSKGAKFAQGMTSDVLIGPDCDPLIAPIVYSVAVQLLSYHTALALGTDVDQPRNLAKSVTVE